MPTHRKERPSSKLLNLKTTYDVVILGGGPAGLAAAISILQQTNLSVLVVDSQSVEHERIGESCPPDTILLLEKLGLSKVFLVDQHARCPGYASVWGRADVGYNDFIVNPLGPAWRINRKKFDKMLANEARKKGAEIAWSFRFFDAQKNKEKEGYGLKLMSAIDKSIHIIQAGFVIDATGSVGRFAKSIGIEKEIEDQLFAMVRFATVVEGHISKQVHLEATENGWWYNTLLPDYRIVSMVVTEKESLPVLRENNHQGFNAALAATDFIGGALRNLELKDDQYHIWPIYSGLLPTIEGNDWMAIGDAASSYDPIVAQGIYKGLTDGIHSVDKVISAFKSQTENKFAFSEHVRSRYQIYLQNRAYVYALEQRWPGSPFWSNRKLKF